MISLFPDQSQLVEDLRGAMRYSKYNLLQASTGSGKTVMSSYLVHASQTKGNRSWFIVPRKELLRQTHTTFDNFGISHSYIASGLDYSPYAKNYICSAPSLIKRLDGATAPHLAIFDEVHYGGESNDTIIQWLKANGSWIVGLSATPWRLSGQGLGRWFERMVEGPSIRWLIDNNRLSDYQMYAPNIPDLSGIKSRAGEFDKGELSGFMEAQDEIIGNAVEHYKEHAMGKLGITYCVSRKHSETMAQRYREAGVPAAHIDGETPDKERKRIILAYARRELLQLTNVQILTFGFDLSAQVGMDVTVETLHDLAPTKSLALQMQKWGRALRYKPFPALIFDHAGNFSRHGFPCDNREWSLNDRTKTQRGPVERTIPTRTCQKCYFVHKPTPSCPQCGYVYPVQYREIDEVAGTLQMVSRYDPGNPQDAAKMQAAIDRMVQGAVKKGVPYDRAIKWAAKQVTQNMVRR